jgi:uncharacterized damage-inducible protein DinB
MAQISGYKCKPSRLVKNFWRTISAILLISGTNRAYFLHMKEVLQQLSAYNVWANQLLLAAIELLPEEKQRQQLVSSFDSLYTTVLHMLDAESIWWQRVKLQERIIRPSENFMGDMKELSRLLMHQSRQWNEWVMQAQEHMLQHVFKYQDSRRESFKQPISYALLQVFNHGTYHRGQLITLLRQVGVEKVPNTDFISWTRKEPRKL